MSFSLHIIPPPKEKQHITMFFVLLWARHSTQASPLNLVKCLDTGAAFVGFGSRSIQWWGSAADVDTLVVNHPPVKQVDDIIEKQRWVLRFKKITMWTFLFMKILPYNSSYFSQKNTMNMSKNTCFHNMSHITSGSDEVNPPENLINEGLWVWIS